MRKAVKEQILQLFGTLQEAHKEMQMYLQKKDYAKVSTVLADCQDGAILIGETIDQFEPEQEQIVHELEKYCEQLYHINVKLEQGDLLDNREIKKELDGQIRSICSAVKDNIKVTWKVVFFPYKASMWTSLASIWKAAQADAECEAKVVVIPYYTLDSDGNKTKLNYEAPLFPADVPIVHYSEYHVEQEHPDMIFIHNPYDDMNNVTRVPEQYYSYNLKPYTEQLIYSPYGMMGYYSPKTGAFMCNTNGAHIADKVLVQSARVKQIYIDHQVERDKIIALGSPKVDALVDNLKQPITCPEEWTKKLRGRKVFLLNTHLSFFIKGYFYKLKYPDRNDYARWWHEHIFEQLLNREDCSLIWRPHPLLKPMLESRNLYSSLEFVSELERMIQESENSVIDRNGDYNIAFQLSDALISTYSSIIPEYMISGKPIYIYQRRLNSENCKNSPVDYTNLYYKVKAGEGQKFPDFVQMVLDGEDPMKEMRMADVHKAFSNLEGTIGKNIYELLKYQ